MQVAVKLLAQSLEDFTLYCLAGRAIRLRTLNAICGVIGDPLAADCEAQRLLHLRPDFTLRSRADGALAKLRHQLVFDQIAIDEAEFDVRQ